MYEKLTKKLRYCGNAVSCINCPYWEGCAGPKEDLSEAANIIEELSNLVNHYGGETGIKDLNEFAGKYWDLLKNVPRWIPVTENLPKTRESILGKKSSKVIVAFHFDDGTQGTDTAHTLNGEWVFEDHITVVARTITHWMPLPEPPKEE